MKKNVFEIEEIAIIPDGENGSSIAAGSESPVGLDYPPGSIYLRSNGEVWKKFGVNTVDWSILGESKSNNLDGGAAFSIYGELDVVDGGFATNG